MEIISKHQAKEQGLKYFFTGKPCKRNHVAKRKLNCGTCYECHKLLNKPYNYNDTVKNRRKNWSSSQRERDALAKSNWCKRNKNSCRNNLAKRRAKLKKALPKWANTKAIRAFYLQCPEGMEVDHIIPLQGILICGLHVENNLQYLSVTENRTKGNKYVSSV